MNIFNHPLHERYDFSLLENMWVKLILDVILELISKKEMCDCHECVLDVIALALNKLPPKYWVSGKFNAFTPPESFIEDPQNLEIAKKAVLESLKQVTQNPHH